MYEFSYMRIYVYIYTNKSANIYYEVSCCRGLTADVFIAALYHGRELANPTDTTAL